MDKPKTPAPTDGDPKYADLMNLPSGGFVVSPKMWQSMAQGREPLDERIGEKPDREG
jgi:hypothetical protein